MEIPLENLYPSRIPACASQRLLTLVIHFCPPPKISQCLQAKGCFKLCILLIGTTLLLFGFRTISQNSEQAHYFHLKCVLPTDSQVPERPAIAAIIAC